MVTMAHCSLPELRGGPECLSWLPRDRPAVPSSVGAGVEEPPQGEVSQIFGKRYFKFSNMSFLFLIAFLLLAARPGAPSSVLVPKRMDLNGTEFDRI